jgi:hypothetical protein
VEMWVPTTPMRATLEGIRFVCDHSCFADGIRRPFILGKIRYNSVSSAKAFGILCNAKAIS